MFLVRSVCLSVCLSVCPSGYSQTCERILMKFFGAVGHGLRTKWYNFCGDPDHASDPGVQSPKSGSSWSAEVCALWVLLVWCVFCCYFTCLCVHCTQWTVASLHLPCKIFVHRSCCTLEPTTANCHARRSRAKQLLKIVHIILRYRHSLHWQTYTVDIG